MTSSWLDFQRFSVWGMARSGKAAANLLARRGKEVVLSDIRPVEDLAGQVDDLDSAVEWVGGKNVIGDAEVIVASPGLKPGLAVFDEARRAGVPVISEVELAFAASSAAWIAITGTDGKTTTTSLTGAMIAASGKEVAVAGNIGTALCDVVDKIGSDGVVVAEISANQLWSCHHLDVYAAAITNVAIDHLDYFASIQDYRAAKTRLVEMQSSRGQVVLPAFDAALIDEVGGDDSRRYIYFGVRASSVKGRSRAVYFDGGRGMAREGGEEICWLPDFSEVALIGPHNQLNAACAAALARTLDVTWEAIREGLLGFRPLPHRMEPVAVIDGVRFIDDSKATNPHASLAGLKGIDTPLIVIAGGLDKGLDLDEWSREVASRAHLVVLIGAITEKMGDMLRRDGGNVVEAQSLEEAVELAKKAGRPGSTVVLSPACSSYDMFDSYKQRGQVFQDAVRALSLD